MKCSRCCAASIWQCHGQRLELNVCSYFVPFSPKPKCLQSRQTSKIETLQNRLREWSCCWTMSKSSANWRTQQHLNVQYRCQKWFLKIKSNNALLQKSCPLCSCVASDEARGKRVIAIPWLHWLWSLHGLTWCSWSAGKYTTHNSEAHCRAVASWACSSLRCCSCSLACQLHANSRRTTHKSIQIIHYISRHAWDCWRSSSTSLDRFSLLTACGLQMYSTDWTCKTPPSTCSTFSTCLHFLVMVIVYLLYLASESPWKPTAAISSRSVAAIALQTNKKEPLRLHNISKQHTTACASVQFSFFQKKKGRIGRILTSFVRQFFLFRIRPRSISLCSVRASAALARIASCFSNSAESPSNPPMAETNN